MLRDLSKLIDDEDSDGGDGDQLQKDMRTPLDCDG